MAKALQSRLEALSPELQELIMSHLTTIQSLRSLIGASPRFYQVLRSNRTGILSTILRHQFHPDVFSDALTTAQASQIARSRRCERVFAFLDNFPFDRRHEELSAKFSLPICIALCRLRRNLNYFVQNFYDYSISVLSQKSPRKSQADSKDSAFSEVLHGPLSDTEIGRLERAFCRFETYGILFSKLPQKGARVTVLEQAQLFLETFPDWEIEEIACIRDYFISRLEKVFDELEDEFVDGMRAGTVRWQSTFLPDRWDVEHHWFSKDAKYQHGSYMENLLSCGLSTLFRIFQEAGKKRKALVISNSNSRCDFLTAALTKPGKRLLASPEEVAKYKLGLMPIFHGDTICGCNGGWMWGHQYHVGLRWANSHMYGLRDWGYVFWDMKRLEESGILDLE